MRTKTTCFCEDHEKFGTLHSVIRDPVDWLPFDVSVEMERSMLWSVKMGQWKKRSFLSIIEKLEKGKF